MNIYIGMCICLGTLTAAAEFTVVTNLLDELDVSTMDIVRDEDSYIVEIREPIDADSICLDMRYQNEGAGRKYSIAEADLCDDDTSTMPGTFAEIVRSSMGISCPVEKGTYTALAQFESEREVDVGAGSKLTLRVVAYKSTNCRAYRGQPQFSGYYTITPVGE